MAIQNISTLPLTSLSPSQPGNLKLNAAGHSQTQFSDFLKTALNAVNDSQVQSDTLTEKLANGGNVDLNQVMVAAQKADITMQAALQIRNKAVESYQEMMRMQV